MKSMYMESENLKAISLKLKNKIKEIENCYASINEAAKNLDGTSENWVGNEQRVFWNKYQEMYRQYPKNLEKLNEFYDFLCKTISDYEERDRSISNDIDVNADKLDV
jgi:uncharacterized protein YukE